MSNKRTRQRITIILAIIGACILVSVIAILGLISTTQTTTQSYNLTAEAYINSVVPEYATDIRVSHQTAFQSVRTKLRFTIPSTELSNFIENYCPDNSITEGGYISLLNDDHIEWWIPEEAEVYMTGGCVRDNIEIYRVLIDITTSQFYVVYMRL